MKTRVLIPLVLVTLALARAHGAALKLDESPAGPGEWGYRPAAGAVSAIDPPAFSWRPQKELTWQLQCSTDRRFASVVYNVEQVEFNVHCPDRVFTPGKYYWRYRGKDADGRYTNWSRVRDFTIAAGAAKMPMPRRSELIGRIPRRHPRLFMRPEGVAKLRALAKGRLKDSYHVIDVLNAAATLGFTYLLDGNRAYGDQAVRLLMECAAWDPVGSTGYRYNDEAGMPYAYYFARTYTFINDLLSDEQKALCRKVMKVRGEGRNVQSPLPAAPVETLQQPLQPRLAFPR